MPRFSIARSFATTVSTTATPTVTATIARRITPTIGTALTVLFGAATVALPAAAQLAPPQWSRPAMDSTHVTGTAARVMPEIVSKPENGLQPAVKAPSTIAELLVAFDGVVLEMPGNERAGAFEQLRFRFSPDRMQSQFTALWNWYDGCSADARIPRCVHGNHQFSLSPEGLTVIRQGCGGLNGSAGGSAEFKWSDFVGFGGAESVDKRWVLQRDSFWTSCYADTGSND